MDADQTHDLTKAIQQLNSTLVREVHHEQFAALLAEKLDAITDRLDRIAAALEIMSSGEE